MTRLLTETLFALGRGAWWLGRHAAARFAWRAVRDTGAHVYEVNGVTRRRRIRRVSGGHPPAQPIDARWLETGRFTQPPRSFQHPRPGSPRDVK